MGQINLLKIVLIQKGSYAKKRPFKKQLHKICKYECIVNMIPLPLDVK